MRKWPLLAAFAIVILVFGIYSMTSPIHLSGLSGPTPATLLLLNGFIDQTMLNQYRALPFPQGILIIEASSPGGYLDPVNAISQSLPPNTVFYAEGYCLSGCVLMASYTSQVYKDTATLFYFGHTGQDYSFLDPILNANKGWNTETAPNIQTVPYSQFISQYTIVKTETISG